MGSPSRRTVQQPQLVVSQPMWVPVRPKTSRMKWVRRSRGSISVVYCSPLTVTVTCFTCTLASLKFLRNRLSQRRLLSGPKSGCCAECPHGVNADDLFLVFGASAVVGLGVTGAGC